MTDRDKRRREDPTAQPWESTTSKPTEYLRMFRQETILIYLCAYMQYPLFALWCLVVVFSRS